MVTNLADEFLLNALGFRKQCLVSSRGTVKYNIIEMNEIAISNI